LLALGGLMLLAGAGVVGHEVSQDWAAHQEASAQAVAAGRPAPEAPGLGLGGFGMALALMGLVPLGFGLVRRHDVGLDRYTLGEGHDATFPVAAEGLPDGEAFPLVSKHGDDELVLRFTAGMRGHVSVDGRRHGLDELVRDGRAAATGSAWALPLPRGAKAKVEHGGVAYLVSSVAGGKAIAKTSEADKPFWIYNGASAAVLGGLLALVHLVPEDALHMNMDELVSENRFVGYMQQPDEQHEPEVADTEEQPDDPKTGDEGQRHAGAAGKMGNPKVPAKSGLYAMKGNKTSIPKMARNFDPELAARNAGILGLMERESGHFLASPFGDAYAVGRDDADVWGGLTGTEVGEAFGTMGLGNLGPGRGGGGNGEGTIGLGNVGTIGKTGKGEGGDKYGPRDGKGIRHGDHVRKQPQVAPAKGSNIVGIDKDVIRRIIRQHHNEIRSCYNQGLTKNPNMQGRVAVMFTIGPAGTVPQAAVSENTLGDRDVANCVASRVRRWTFPKPFGGGTAMVTYPFAFTLG
jgi:hypothetical protein